MAVSDVFATPLDGVGDLGRIFAGLGFWNLGFQLAPGNSRCSPQ